MNGMVVKMMVKVMITRGDNGESDNGYGGKMMVKIMSVKIKWSWWLWMVAVDVMIVMYKIMTVVASKDYANVSRGSEGVKGFGKGGEC